MPEITANIIWPNLIVGLIVLTLGILVVKFRATLNDQIYRSQKSMLGRRIADASAGRQKPFVMGLVGFFFALIGITMIFWATVGILQNWL